MKVLEAQSKDKKRRCMFKAEEVNHISFQEFDDVIVIVITINNLHHFDVEFPISDRDLAIKYYESFVNEMRGHSSE